MVTTPEIPHVQYAFVNGSGTWAARFPEDCRDETVTVVKEKLVFETPYGETVPLKLIHIEAKTPAETTKDVLVIPMHGYHYDSRYSKNDGTDQIFWVMQQAGVKRIISEASVGGINRLLEPGDLVVPDDFIEGRVERGHAFQGRDMRMGSPFCPALRQILIEQARQIFPRVMRCGVSVSVDGPRYETAAEIRMFARWGADIVGQTLTPEIYYARTIGAHFGILNIVSNFAEGLDDNFETGDMMQFYRDCAVPVGRIILNAMKRASLDNQCHCDLYRPRELDRVRPTVNVQNA